MEIPWQPKYLANGQFRIFRVTNFYKWLWNRKIGEYK